MVQPSISQHRSPKVARMRSFCSVGETNWSPETTRPSRTLMSGATAAAAAHAASKGRNGSRKIEASPGRSDVTVSRRRVCCIMRENGLAGAYGRKGFKVHPGAVNEADVSNVVARGFIGRAPCTHICSDLACVRVGASWNYVCLLVDLCNGEIVGHSEGPRRDARAPSQALGLRALVQQLQDPLDAGLHVAGRVRGGGAVPPGIVQISVANPAIISAKADVRKSSA